MAKIKKNITLTNCFWDSQDLTQIQEIGKEDTKFYCIYDIMREFADMEGVSLSISVSEELTSIPDEGADDE